MRFVVTIGITLGATACSLFTSLDDFEGDVRDDAGSSIDGSGPGNLDGGSSGGSDANGNPDAIIIPAADAAPDGGYANLHPNGSMEFSCQGWYPYNATLETSATAHGGNASCMVCADKTVSDTATIDEGGAVLNPVVGGVYVASGWFRVPDGKTSPPGGIKLVFGTRDASGGTVESQSSAKMSIDTSWKQFAVQLPITMPAAKLRIWAGGTAELGTCFLADDLRIERWQ